MVSTNAAGRTDAFSSSFPYRSANQRSVCGSERRSNTAIRSFRRQAETKRAQFASTRRRTRPLNSGAHDCSGQSLRVSFDPPRPADRSRGVFLRCRRRALTAPTQEAGACRAPRTVLCRTVRTALSWFIHMHAPYVEAYVFFLPRRVAGRGAWVCR